MDWWQIVAPYALFVAVMYPLFDTCVIQRRRRRRLWKMLDTWHAHGYACGCTECLDIQRKLESGRY